MIGRPAKMGLSSSRMNHPPFLKGGTVREIQAVQNLHQIADSHSEPEVRQALSGALELIVELIEERGKRRDLVE
jgi:hypothetical protein